MTLPAVVSRLEAACAVPDGTNLGASGEAVLEDLFSQYTMERERAVHMDFLRHSGLASKEPAPQVQESAVDDGVLLF